MQKAHEVEIFKEIAGFPGYYISTFGRVKSHKRKTNGYKAQQELGILEPSINLCCNGKRKTAGGYVWRFKCS